jgi:hypothetical protein
MSQKISNLAPKTQNKIAAVAAPPAADVDDGVAGGDEPAKKQRQAYEPKTALEFEQEITVITEALRAFKTRLYPTSAPKACLDRAPTRREFDDQISSINALKRDYKAQVRRADQKPRRKAAPANGKPRAGGFKNPCVVDEKLAQFIADNFNSDSLTVIDESRICTRALLTSMLTQYAYDHNRRDPTAATKVIPDAAMKELFKDDFEKAGVDPTGFPHTHMQKVLTRHVLPSAEFKAYVLENKIDLETYKPHLEQVQDHFKAQKLVREASKPKPRKKTAAAKKAEEAAVLAQAE